MKLAGAAVLTVEAGLFLAASRWTPWPAPVAGGIGLAFALAVPSFWAVSATLHRSDALFFGAFAGGMLVRLAVLVGAVLAVHFSGRWPVAPFAVAAAAGLLGFTVVELIFLQRQNRRWTSSTRSNTTSSTTSTSA